METFSITLGGMDPSQHVAEDLGLPIIPDVGAVVRCREALDAAAATRRGLLVVGPKGVGKGIGVSLATQWFADVEKAKASLDDSYVRRKVLRIRDVRDATYRETAVNVARQLSKRYQDRVRGRKKDPNEIRADVVNLCLARNYVALVLDEAERCSDATLLFVRDVMADAEEVASDRIEGDQSHAAGVGVVIVGDPSVEDAIGRTNEGGERWARRLEVPPLAPQQVVHVYSVWFPGFATHVQAVGDEAWETYLSSLICRGPVSFRLLENHARTFVLYMTRSKASVSSREDVPFDRALFELSWEQVTWARHTRPNGGPPASAGGGTR
jgi:hypothetical protein